MDEPVATRRVLIVANPKARGYAPGKIEAVRDALSRWKIEVECAHMGCAYAPTSVAAIAKALTEEIG